MLDKMRKHSRSFIIYIFFGIIIAVFVINFGPQSQGCVAETTYAGHIDGEPLSLNDLNYALAVTGLRGRAMSSAQMAQLRAMVLDRLFVRELLVTEARDRGLRIPDKEINDMLLEGRYLAMGEPRQMIRDESGIFDYDLFSRYVRYNWGITVRKFQEQQRRELLATKMRMMLRTAIEVADSEVEQRFRHDHTQSELYFVRFDPERLRVQVQLDEAKVAQFIAKQSDAIAKQYEANKAQYTNVAEQVRVRVIDFEFDKTGGKNATLRKAKNFHQKISNGQDFTKLAQTTSPQGGAKTPWARPGWLGLDPAVNKAIEDLKPGQVSEPIEQDSRVTLVKLEGRRKGDLTLDQVQDDIARDLLTKEAAKQLAEKQAKGYLDRLKTAEDFPNVFGSENNELEDDALDKDLAAAAAKAMAQKKSPFDLKTAGPFSKSADHLVPGVGISEELTTLAFTLDNGAVVDHPIEVGGVIFLAAVKKKTTPDMKQWAKDKAELVDQFKNEKWTHGMQEFEHGMCEQAVNDKRLSIDIGALVPPAAPGTKTVTPPPAYIPCQTLRMM